MYPSKQQINDEIIPRSNGLTGKSKAFPSRTMHGEIRIENTIHCFLILPFSQSAHDIGKNTTVPLSPIDRYPRSFIASAETINAVSADSNRVPPIKDRVTFKDFVELVSGHIFR